MPIAVNCCVSPTGRDGLVGVTAIETKAAAETVKLVWSDTVPNVAATVVIPTACEVARPELPIVAVLVLVEDQVTADVRSLVLPSEYFPVAVNCSVVPNGIELLAGVTAMDARTCAVTVRDVCAFTPLAFAVISVVPTVTVAANPEELMVATAVLEEVQVRLFVRSLVLPSE